MCAGSLCFCFISQDLGAWGETLRPPPTHKTPSYLQGPADSGAALEQTVSPDSVALSWP